MKKKILNLTFNYVKDIFYPIVGTILLFILPVPQNNKFFYVLSAYFLILIFVTFHYLMRILQKRHTVHLNGETRDWMLILVIFAMLPYLL
ncbi:hypothetical protein [Leuconostoc citreum]